MRSVVDLPEPFGPRKPVTNPGTTSNVSRSTAIASPNRLVSSRTSIMALRSSPSSSLSVSLLSVRRRLGVVAVVFVAVAVVPLASVLAAALVLAERREQHEQREDAVLHRFDDVEEAVGPARRIDVAQEAEGREVDVRKDPEYERWADAGQRQHGADQDHRQDDAPP